MSKNIFKALAELDEQLESVKAETDNKLDQIQMLSLIADCNDHLFATNNIVSGRFSDSAELNCYSSFEKLVSLIPKKNFIQDYHESRSSAMGIEFVKREENYYILLDEKTLMQLTLTIRSKTDEKTIYMFSVLAKRSITPLKMSGVKFGKTNCVMIEDDEKSLFRICTFRKKCDLRHEPVINILNPTNLEDTFMSKLIESLGLEVNNERKKTISE